MILTHSCRLKDFNHTSFAEIQSFAEILKDNQIFRSIEIRDYSELENVAYVDDLTIFAVGKDMNEEVVRLANSCKNLYIVIQDPNWPTSLKQIKREFVLITPFRALEDQELRLVKRNLKYHIASLDTKFIADHRVVDFGSMLVYNRKYVDRYWKTLENHQSIDKNQSMCYIGSLKQDRIVALSTIASKNKVEFYGNFTEKDFAKMSGSNRSIENCVFHGKINPTDVLKVYLSYDEVIFCPDDKIFDLGTSYLRIGEMCLAEIKPVIVSRRKDILDSLDDLLEDESRLSWSKFIQKCHERDLIAQIREAYQEVIE